MGSAVFIVLGSMAFAMLLAAVIFRYVWSKRHDSRDDF